MDVKHSATLSTPRYKDDYILSCFRYHCVHKTYISSSNTLSNDTEVLWIFKMYHQTSTLAFPHRKQKVKNRRYNIFLFYILNAEKNIHIANFIKNQQ